MPAFAGLSLAWLLAFGPPTDAPTAELRVDVAFPDGTADGPHEALFECPDVPGVKVDVDDEGVAMVQGPVGALCTLMIRADDQWYLAVVELGTHSFEQAEAQPIPYGPDEAFREESAGIHIAGTTAAESHYTVDGASVGRDFTSVVEVSGAVLVRDAAHGTVDLGQEPFVPGTLTAGAVDDLARRKSFQDYTSTVPWLAEDFGSRWAAVRVVDQRGRPVRGVAVEVEGPRGTATVRTRSDGHAVFLAEWDGLGDVHKAQARIDQGPTIRLKEGRTVKGTVRRVVEPVQKVDLALVLDTTGSMADELAYLQTELRAIFDDLEREYRQLDVRFAMVVYRDTGDAYTVRGLDFTRDFDAFEAALAEQYADGGGDNPEAVHTAFESAAELEWRSPTEAARVVVHVADAPPHAERMTAALRAVDELRRQGTAIYPVAASGTDQEAEFFMRATALMTAGQYVFLTDDSGYGNPHREASQACFDVSTLADVLTSILTAQLEAKRARLPRGFDSRCNPNRAIGSPRRPSRGRGVQDYLGHSLMDDPAASHFLHQPFVRHRL